MSSRPHGVSGALPFIQSDQASPPATAGETMCRQIQQPREEIAIGGRMEQALAAGLSRQQEVCSHFRKVLPIIHIIQGAARPRLKTRTSHHQKFLLLSR